MCINEVSFNYGTVGDFGQRDITAEQNSTKFSRVKYLAERYPGMILLIF